LLLRIVESRPGGAGLEQRAGPPARYLPVRTSPAREEPAIANSFPARYCAGMRLAGGACPIEGVCSAA